MTHDVHIICRDQPTTNFGSLTSRGAGGYYHLSSPPSTSDSSASMIHDESQHSSTISDSFDDMDDVTMNNGGECDRLDSLEAASSTTPSPIPSNDSRDGVVEALVTPSQGGVLQHQGVDVFNRSVLIREDITTHDW